MTNLFASEGGYQLFELGSAEWFWLTFSLVVSLLALGVGAFAMKGVLAKPTGTAEMEEIAGAVQAHPAESLRKVAVLVRNLDKEVRDGILEAIQQKDSEAGEKVMNLMVTWDDIPQIGGRSLQKALRGVDERQLALALHEVAEEIDQAIKANISERAAALVSEEASLMSAPKKEDIRLARDKIVEGLRELNRNGELTFVEQ